jgi:hypothetical protein
MDEIVKQLTIIAKSLSENNYFSDIIPWLLGLVSTSIGGIIGYIISSRQDKKRFIRESHIEYMKLTNEFLSDINNLITSMVNIQKISFLLIGDQNDPDKYELFFYKNLNYYNLVVNKVRALRKYIDTIDFNTEEYSSKNHYKEQIVKLSDDILNFNIFVSICSKYEKNAVNYYYFINKKLREDHADIINNISNATTRNMTDFNIEDTKKQIVLHIQKINENIIGHKLVEKNLFNQIDDDKIVTEKKDA